MASISPPLLLMPSISAQLSSAPWPARSLALRALREFATTGDLEAPLRYQIHGGRSRERAVVAGPLRTCGLRVDADDVVTGAQYGLAVTAMALVRPGDVVAVDALTYPGFTALAQSMRFELARIRGLRDAPVSQPARMAHGRSRPPRLIEIARRFEPLIIEGASYAYLVENPPPPFAALAPDITICVVDCPTACARWRLATPLLGVATVRS